MDLSTTVNLALCVLSFILVVISVSVSVLTLRQNKKMIEASTRPYITVSSETTDFSTPTYYLVVKNHGSSGGTVESFSSDINLSLCSYSQEYTPFAKIVGTFFAPGQRLVCVIDHNKLQENNCKRIQFKIAYRSMNKSYKEEYEVNFEAYMDLTHARTNTADKELKTISYILQDLVEKTF